MSGPRLLDRFAVYGRFYRAEIAGCDESLRDRLEIAPRDWSLARIAQRQPELLVVMMNPGGSRPCDPADDAPGASPRLVPAVPDRTQYQIMRLLLAAQASGRAWQHARVVNLSDLRTPRSADLLHKLGRYAQDDRHSLFGRSRGADCRAVFAESQVPVVLAWGLHPGLAMWARLALAASQGHPRFGISTDGVSFRHPLPQRQDLQLRWLAEVGAQIAAFPAA